ncbi:MAG TPA: MarR family winged helix-turn-helix transcriptional regulator [Pseudonocardiaceae bacterium]|nr:MarR family winged helix-turn-helix transcriptional regulator [Pseudonocardiaceae bacterium]
MVDRRRHIVAITAKGERAPVDVRSALAGVERELFADLSSAELARLRRLLSRVRARPGDRSCVGCGQDQSSPPSITSTAPLT